MAEPDPFGADAARPSPVAPDGDRLSRHAALVAEMSAAVSTFALQRLRPGDAPWSFHTLRLEEAARADRPGERT